MKKKTFFKMVVISSVLLITGGILIACGNKKVEQTTEVITEISTESVIETSIEDAGITIDGYNFSIPDEFDFKGQDENMYVYMNGDTTLSILSNSFSNNYEDITGDFLYAQMKKDWTPDGATELDYSCAEKDGVKKGFYSIGIKANNETFVQYVTCYIIGKDKRAITIVVFDKATSEEDIDDVINTVEKINKDFEKQNLWPAE